MDCNAPLQLHDEISAISSGLDGPERPENDDGPEVEPPETWRHLRLGGGPSRTVKSDSSWSSFGGFLGRVSDMLFGHLT